MRILHSLLLLSLALVSCVFAQEAGDAAKTKFDYQSDVSRLRKIVINSLYSHRDVWLRELISNANDALEKFRLTALTTKDMWDSSSPLNITIKAVKNEDGPGGKIIITDTGIGMNQEELTANLGTLAKSGTSEFLAKAENSADSSGTSALIGSFGVGFYSSFLVADRVYVASIPAKSDKNPNPSQHVFSSTSEDSSFEVYPDPRGNTLGHGTEITLILKDDAYEYLDTLKLTDLVDKHSSFSTTFPMYLFTQRTEQVPDEDSSEKNTTPVKEVLEDTDDDEVLIEDVVDEAPEPPKTKDVIIEEWVKLNPQAPIWMRDAKDVTDEEHELFYQATFKDYANKPAAWQHFSGDSSGASFRGIIYIPSKIDNNYWQTVTSDVSKDIRLLVKRVFITSDFGDSKLPKWAGWVKVVVDAEDLPLNVSRETLQSTRFLRQIKQVILRHLIQLFNKLAEEDPEKFQELLKSYNNVFKIGAVEDTKNQAKLASLARFNTNQRETITLDSYVENKRKGQTQVFYMADIGKTREQLSRSVFVEKLAARGYEVLLLSEPLDEILLQNLRKWKSLSFQDVAKSGLKFGDEDLDAEEEKERESALKEKFEPLLLWLAAEASGVVRNVIISNRLVTSSCAIVADTFGYTANVEKLMNAAHNQEKNPTQDFMKKQKILEINPNSPLIEGLLHRVQQLPSEEEGRDLEAEEELKEVTSILIDGALVRSGFEVPDSNEFFIRVDRVLRRSLGVSQTATTDTEVKPAPPVDSELKEEEEEVLEIPTIVPEKEEKISFGFDGDDLQGQAAFEIPDGIPQHTDHISFGFDGEDSIHDEL